MTVKRYKLIPVSFFENYGKPGEFVMDNVNSDEKTSLKNVKADDEDVSKFDQGRSISNIIDENMRKTNFTPSNHHVADFKFGKLPQKGSGLILQSQLRDPTLFQEYSPLPVEKNVQKAFTLKKIDPDLKNLLSDSSISDDLKLKLYNMYQSKYDMREKLSEVESDGDDDFTSEIGENSAGPRKIINKFVGALPNAHKKKGEILADFLIKEKKYIQWNADGEIIVPELNDIGAFNLNNLIRAILYKKGILSDHVKITAQIIGPFYDKLQQRNLIGNESQFRRILKQIKKDTKMSSYISW